MSVRRATNSVLPATLIWLGAGSPRAAATNDGADMDEPDSTAQSRKNVLMRSPRLVLKMATTRRSSGLSSWARSAAWKLPRSSWRSRASDRADWTPAAVKALASRSARSMIRTLGSRAMRGPWSCSRDRSRTVTSSP